MKIVICVLISFLISFSILYIVLSKYDTNHLTKDEISFYQNVNRDKQIFIIGSSQVLAINATHIKTIITKNFSGYDVYNLGKASDMPKNRIISLDLIINSKPDLIIYGIGFRDIQKIPLGGFGTLVFADNKINTQTNYLPDIHDLIEQQILTKLGFFNLNLEFLDNPKFVILNIMKTETQKKDFLQKESKIYEFVDVPFYHPSEQELNGIKKSVSEDKIIDCGRKMEFDPIYKDRNLVSLVNMINKLQENNIKVVLFTVPYHKKCIDNFDIESKLQFESTIKDIANQTQTDVYFLHDSYRGLDTWYDNNHLTFQNMFYSDDIAKIIIKKLVE